MACGKAQQWHRKPARGGYLQYESLGKPNQTLDLAVPDNDSGAPGEEETAMNSPKRPARMAGVLYLLVAIFGGFAQRRRLCMEWSPS